MNWRKWLGGLILSASLVVVGCGGGNIESEIDAVATEMAGAMKDPTKMVEVGKKADALKKRIEAMSAADKEKYSKMLGEKILSKMMQGVDPSKLVPKF
ncbi:MAG: hypothetical protein L0Y72_28285 [Gemmataceae bacterium]|nr:hypothetical protein [Gemmataceae bacterium]MCI0742946.1 hypothetical protein [Gemmataceae bacterium]